ncbi:MAG: hypothetical protein K2H30_04505, partial [Clostridia bacterium]|nr:hypothetical protein [Clostridia bacterium]
MKKVKSLLITTILAVCAAIACLAFAACSNNDTALEGTYKFSSMTMTIGEETTTVKAGEEFNGITISKDYFVMEINNDGTFSISSAMGIDEEGTWEEEDGVLKLTADGETIEAEHSGKT